jgi:hypothetical protein
MFLVIAPRISLSRGVVECRSMFALLLLLLCCTSTMHASRHVCDTDAVEVSIREYVQDANNPAVTDVTVDVTDKCPDDDDLEGIWIKLAWCSGACDFPLALTFVDDILEPSSSHKTVFHSRFDQSHLSRVSRISRVYVEAFKVTGSHFRIFKRDGTERPREPGN